MGYELDEGFEMEEKQYVFSKSMLLESGKAKVKQGGKYVLYYIFYHEDPVYVGITKNFELRKSQHFSSLYRANDSKKKLYKHMAKNSIEDYSMYVIAQSNKAKSIDSMEKLHIEELREIGLAETNVAKGGGYVRSFNTTKMILENFYEEFCAAEKRFLEEDGYIDKQILEEEMDNIDWDALYSVVDCWENDILNDYDRFLKSEKHEEEDYSMEAYMENDMEDFSYSPYDFFDVIIAGINSVPSNIKQKSVDRFMSTVRFLENIEDKIDVYIGLKILLSGDYEESINPIIDKYDREVESVLLIEMINPFAELEGEFKDVDFIY